MWSVVVFHHLKVGVSLTHQFHFGSKVQIRIRIRIVMEPSIVYIDNVLSHMPPEATGSTSSSNPPQIRIQIVLFKIIILPGACFHAPAIS